MEHGNIPVVFTLEELKEIYDRTSYGKVGMWAFHSIMHEGHISCAQLARNECDYVICVNWNNFGEGCRVIVGDTVDHDPPLNMNEIEFAKQYSDVIIVFTGDYHPYTEERYKNYLEERFDSLYPEKRLKDLGIFDELNLLCSLKYSVFVRILIHELYNIKVHYHPTSGRDRWRTSGYNDWLLKEYGCSLDIRDPKQDNLGNNMSGTKNKIPKEVMGRINKKLLYPHFKTIDDLKEHIKDIDGLQVQYFFREHGWIQAKFCFDDYPQYWLEGIKLCKSLKQDKN